MIGYAYNKNTGKIDMSGEYELVKAFTDSSCYEVLTLEELNKKLNGDM